MGRKINIDVFDLTSINNAIKELTDYSNDLQRKCELFCDRLATIGYVIAQDKASGVTGRYGTHRMEDYVFFRISKQPYAGGCEAYLLGLEKTFVSTWKSKGQIYSALICPLEMLEFGTGVFAKSQDYVWEQFNVHSGNGTLAIAGHESDRDWGKNDNWSAIKPTMPMYSAYIQMFRDINKVAKDIFKEK